MKSVSDGLDSISVFQSIISGVPPTHLIYLLLLSFPLLLCSAAPTQAVTPLQSAVLAKLGLTTPPPSYTAPAPPVPDYIHSLYRKAEEGMLDEDSIRLFYPQELLDLNSGLLLSYNLSIEAQQAQKEKVVGAHIKLRVRGHGSVRVYRVADLTRLKVERLLDSVEITREEGEEEERVIDLDVTEGVPYSNQQHAVRLLVVFPEDASLADSPTDSLSSIGQSRAASAAMVLSYVAREEGDVQEENEHPKRRKRFADEEKRRKERKERRRKNRKHRNGGEKGICHRKSMYVDFEDLQWSDWILAPKGYEAYQCSGGCPYPFPAKVNASNHAIIQGLLHNYNDEIPEPCCVPTEMAHLTILYRDVDARISIKNYPDMIVAACGCR